MTKEDLVEVLKQIVEVEKRFDYDIQHSKYWSGDEAASYLAEAVAIAAEALKTCETDDNKKESEKPLKQAYIISYACDQSTTCKADRLNTKIGDEPLVEYPLQREEDLERSKNNFYGLSPSKCKRLLAEKGYEWVWIEHSGSRTYIHDASKGFKFQGAYAGMKPGQWKQW